MPRTDERRVAFRFGLLALGWLGALFAWGCLLSFDAADPPSTTVWPHNDPPRNLAGHGGAWLAYHAFTWLGAGAYPLLALLTGALAAWSRGVRLNDLWLRFVGLLLIVAATATGAALALAPAGHHLVTGPGGLLGTAAAQFLAPRLETFGTAILLIVALLVGLLLAADNLFLALVRGLHWTGTHSGPALARGGRVVASAGAVVASGVVSLTDRLSRGLEPSAADAPAGGQQPAVAPAGRRPKSFGVRPAAEEEDVEPDEEAVCGAAGPDGGAPQAGAAQRALRAAEIPIGPLAPGPAGAVREPIRPAALRGPGRPPAAEVPADRGAYVLPPADLLERVVPVDKAAIEALCREKAYVLEQTLNEFRLEVEVVAIETGPVITVFELKLAPGIKVSQIASLSNDMARALKAPAVRVVAPLPGKNTIGIEVPNVDKEKVRLRDVMELFGPRAEPVAVPLYLGKDAAGQPLVADLTRMPHLLIAGTTGSGKSVCVTSVIVSILMTRTPDEVKLILVDPKVVELGAYKDVPHLMCPIVTEAARAESILEWASIKMDERYALLAEAGVKDIRAYNRLGYERLRERIQPTSDEEMAQVPIRLPYIVIIIDELADLMMSSAKEVEFYLCRIAQKSRAVGIHLIVSTQRPQANVVTGLIKSNLPCRIAFRVSSRLDSRIVLDQNGGEVLMGQGDMLFLPPGSSKLVRAQGTFVDDEELRRIVRHCREQRSPDFHPELARLPAGDGDAAGERDELFDPAVDIIVSTGRGSVSLLQRRLNVGYSRASRLIDQMYAAGIVGEYKGSQAREVLVTAEEWAALRQQRDREEAAEAAEASGEHP